jgi:TPP-dependent pyruvate/acetoin dehydrogenase alpha subunit
VAKRAIDHARAGKGPYLVEFKTFRTHGHGEHDDMGYVDAELRAFWERRDPLRLFREYLCGADGFGEAAVQALDNECTEVIEAAVIWAEAQPEPAPESVGQRIFAP